MSDSTYIKHTGTPMGRGVFARSPIGEGDLIEVCHVVCLQTAYADLPEEIQRIVFNWERLANRPGVSTLVLGNGRMYNHANPANARYKAIDDGERLQITAARPIEVGEEITINYNAAAGEPISTEDNWFEATGVELYVSERTNRGVSD